MMANNSLERSVTVLGERQRGPINADVKRQGKPHDRWKCRRLENV